MQHSGCTNGPPYSVQTVLWVKSSSLEKKKQKRFLIVHVCSFANTGV